MKFSKFQITVQKFVQIITYLHFRISQYIGAILIPAALECISLYECPALSVQVSGYDISFWYQFEIVSTKILTNYIIKNVCMTHFFLKSFLLQSLFTFHVLISWIKSHEIQNYHRSLRYWKTQPSSFWMPSCPENVLLKFSNCPLADAILGIGFGRSFVYSSESISLYPILILSHDHRSTSYAAQFGVI